jgi:hypothetical protein
MRKYPRPRRPRRTDCYSRIEKTVYPHLCPQQIHEAANLQYLLYGLTFGHRHGLWVVTQ